MILTPEMIINPKIKMKYIIIMVHPIILDPGSRGLEAQFNVSICKLRKG
jgi:hypothetical protein